MKKEIWRAGNMLYPLPAVMASCADKEGNQNMLTVAWCGTICSDPAMVYISVRKERHSYHMIEQTGEYVLNLTTEALAFATDYAGVRSGAKENKIEVLGLHTQPAAKLKYAPLIEESPVNIECKVVEVKDLGSHTMFMANVEAVQVDPRLLNEKGALQLNDAHLITYCHGTYRGLGKKIGTFGFSVAKKKRKNSKPRKHKRNSSH